LYHRSNECKYLQKPISNSKHLLTYHLSQTSILFLWNKFSFYLLASKSLKCDSTSLIELIFIRPRKIHYHQS
jgi:hypothetical protein